MREKISGCVTACNEEKKIRRCLESLSFCDEIVVIDSFSTDRTVEICKEYTDRVYQHKWLGYIGQKNLIRQLARHPWVFFLDADEEISPALRAELLEEFAKGAETYAGFAFPRQVEYLGRWIRHGEWNPDIKLRLFRKELGESSGREPHDQVKVQGPVKTLTHPIRHYTYDSIYDHIKTLNRFSSITAQEKFREGGRAHWMNMVLRPPLRFLKGYVAKRGFLDGSRGLIVAMLCAYGVGVKYAKIWELMLQEGLEREAGRHRETQGR